MAGAIAGVTGQKRRPRQRQIAHGVQHLVAHGLVLVAQAAGGQHLVAVDHNCVHIGAAKRQPIGAHGVHVRLAAEGAAVHQLAHEGAIGHVQHLFLTPDRGIGKFDVEVDFQMIRRAEARKGLALAVFDRTFHPDRLQRHVLAADAHLQDAGHELRRGAVEDRHFRPVDADHGILNAGARQRGHHVFDGGHGGALAVVDQRAQLRRRDVRPQCRNAVAARLQVGAFKDDPVGGRCRADVHANRRAGVKADAPEFCRFRNGCLHGSSHLLSDRELTFPRIFQLGSQARILN